jgi:hypothetical protein
MTMSHINDQLATVDFSGDPLSDDELLTDVIVLARVTRLSDGRRTFLQAFSNDIDPVIHLGLLECGREVAGETPWTFTNDGDDD